MSPSRVRYITACQQLLALSVVLAVLVPAAAVVSLDVIRDSPVAGDTSDAPGPVDDLAVAAQRRTKALARGRAAIAPRAAVVPTETVDPVVIEVPIRSTTADGRRRTTGGVAAADRVRSEAEPVTGFGAIGVTWASGVDLAEGEVAVQVRTRTEGAWSGWQPMEYHDDHGADPGSVEAAGERPGTDEALVGHVDDVQVQVTTTGAALPPDLSLAVIDPGTSAGDATEAPALTAPTSRENPEVAGDGLALSAATTGAAQPTIYSRAQWGADERVREQSAPAYGVIQGGFVHHTVNANDYTADEVPGIIRSIYAYHVKSRGWRDIGYNFLVDRFGRIWEGRYGGIDKPVVGAHTSGYNANAFAMSAIGNFDLVQPSPQVIAAYANLFAWKLAISGVSAAATNVRIGSKTFASSIMGHRDAGSTACPGQYLYAQIPAIRTAAAQAQGGVLAAAAWSGRQLSSTLVGSAYPDVILRRAFDGRGVILPTEGLTRFAAPARVGGGWKSARQVVLTPDVTGDKRSDLISVGSNGSPRVRPGKANGRFGKTKPISALLRGYAKLTAVGDLDRDRRHDLVGRDKAGRLTIFHGTGKRTFRATTVAGSWKAFSLLAGAGDLTGDRRDDLLARDRKGRLFLFAGTKKGLAKKVRVPGTWSGYDAVAGGGDVTGDGRADLVVRQKGTGDAYVLPGLGGTAFGSALGPVAQLKGIDDLGVAPVGAGGAIDLIGRSGNKLIRQDGVGTRETSAPIETNLDLTGATAVLDAGDFDRDGTGDVIVRDAAGALQLRPGTGSGTFGDPVTLATGFGGASGLVAVADRTGDGNPDLAGSINGVTTVWPGNARGQVGAGVADPTYAVVPAGTNLSGYDWVVPVSDGNGDGVADILVRYPSTGQLFLLPGGPQALGTRRLVAEGMQAYDLAG